MRAVVITIVGNERSEVSALRCIESGAAHGVRVVRHEAVTPRSDPMEMFKRFGWTTHNFTDNPYSRTEPCMAAFLSHALAWRSAVETGESVLVLEHDAVFIAPLPPGLEEQPLCSVGWPSFGRWVTPPSEGYHAFMSKPGGYLGGAHAYHVAPEAAERMLESAREEAEPTDVFIRRQRFPELTEYYPWPVHVRETYTTIQSPLGCKAKPVDVDIIPP